MLSKDKLSQIRKQYVTSDAEVPRLFDVLGDLNRWNIFRLLLELDDLCVTELATILNVSVPAVSQQLRMMEMSGLIRKERNGQMVCYKVEKENRVARLATKLAKAS